VSAEAVFSTATLAVMPAYALMLAWPQHRLARPRISGGAARSGTQEAGRTRVGLQRCRTAMFTQTHTCYPERAQER